MKKATRIWFMVLGPLYVLAAVFLVCFSILVMGPEKSAECAVYVTLGVVGAAMLWSAFGQGG